MASQVPLLLHNLPKALNTYDVRTPTAPPPEDKQLCFVCWRPYGHVDNPFDKTEKPCSTLQYPCGHYIGSDCFKKLVASDLPMTCHMCQRPIPNKNESTIRTLEWIATSVWYTYQTESVREVAIKRGDRAEFDELSQLLFDGDMNTSQAGTLWQLYVRVPWVGTLRFLGTIIQVHAVFWALGWLVGHPYVELFFVSRLFHLDLCSWGWAIALDFLITVIGVGIQLYRVGELEDDLGKVPLTVVDMLFGVFLTRSITLLLGTKEAAIVAGVNLAALGVVTAALLYCGTRKRE